MLNNIIWYQYLIVNPYALSTTVAWVDPEGGTEGLDMCCEYRVEY